MSDSQTTITVKDRPADLPVSNPKTTSYSQMLKSSVLIGGSSGINIILGIIRTKVIAILLGPSGVGLVGLYSSIAELTKSLAGMGMGISGVRQIAAAVGTGDEIKIARTVKTLRRMAMICGLVGTAGLILLSYPISRFTFGDGHHASSIILLSFTVLFAAIGSGQAALVQGMRQIGNLAKISIIGGLLGTFFSVSVVYLFGQQGIVMYLVFVAATGILASWWYARKIKVVSVSMSWREMTVEAAALLKMGVAFMASGFLVMGAAYLIRTIISRNIGVEAVGFYQSAWTIAGLYVGFVLQAMGADFFPRLTSNANNHAECNRLINEQIEIGLLLVGPGVLATLTFAPLVIEAFYSAKFGPSVELLRWFCLGMYLRIVSWPLGFLLLAKGKGKTFIVTEFVTNAFYLGLAWLLIKWLGLMGSGVAFFGLYLFYWPMIYLVARRLSGYQFNVINSRIMLFTGTGMLVLLIGSYWLPNMIMLVIGVVLTALASFLSLKRMCSFVHTERIPASIQKILTRFRLIPAMPR